MPKVKTFPIKESMEELKALLKKQSPYLAPRVRLLIECKKHEATGISKNALAEAVGINHNSVTSWRKKYIENGIEGLLKHGKIGFKPSIINHEEHNTIAEKLKNPTNQLQGYKELLEWAKKEFNKPLQYKTLYAYVKRHFGTKIKVARKSHIKKDAQAGEVLKKTSVFSAKPSLKKKPKTTTK